MADYGIQMPDQQQDQSPLFANLLGQGGGGMDPETLRTLAALKAYLAGQNQGGQTFVNPLVQADAISQINARDSQRNPIMGPQSNGIKFLFPGGAVMPPQLQQGGGQGGDPYRDATRAALITNLLSSVMKQSPNILNAFRRR